MGTSTIRIRDTQTVIFTNSDILSDLKSYQSRHGIYLASL